MHAPSAPICLTDMMFMAAATTAGGSFDHLSTFSNSSYVTYSTFNFNSSLPLLDINYETQPETSDDFFAPCHLSSIMGGQQPTSSSLDDDLELAQISAQVAEIMGENPLHDSRTAIPPANFDSLLDYFDAAVNTPASSASSLSSIDASPDSPQFFDPEEPAIRDFMQDIEATFSSSSSADSSTDEHLADVEAILFDSPPPQQQQVSSKRKLDDDDDDKDERLSLSSAVPAHKKEANKRAAIRYRSKKLKEKDALFEECAEYARRNELLRAQIDEVQSEISLIKNLLVQALIAKNVKNS